MRALALVVLPVILLACGDKRTGGTGDDSGSGGENGGGSADADGDGYEAGEDCDDTDAIVHPGASEICDGTDNDCDGTTDEGVTSTYYADADADGFGDDGASTEACSEPAGHVAVGNDCDDASAETYPGAAERCDDLDNDCDGQADEEVQTTWYADGDGDGFGDPASEREDCNPPAGHVADGTDCDDDRDDAHPGATEVCDNHDNDCDGTADEGVTTTYYRDSDGDGHGLADVTTEACARPGGYAVVGGDCDDSEDDTYPGADEHCNSTDDDCDGTTDEADALDTDTWYADGDGDGYGDPSSTQGACAQPSGYVASSTDCDDASAAAYPGAAERCDGVDTDCDGTVDEDDATDASTWYIDYDRDGYGSVSYSRRACTQPSGYVASSTDCDDAASTVYPSASEYCNGDDDDCDGSTDEGAALDADTWYADRDGDGFGDPDSSQGACSRPSGHVEDASDCYDGDADAWPGSTGTETPGDGIDTDCDGYDGCEDLNCDGQVDLLLGQHYGTTTYGTASYLYYNTGGGFADSSRASIASVGAYDIEARDLDQDGYIDIAVANYYSGSSYTTGSYIYWGSAAGYSTADRATLATNGPLRVEIADFDADGWDDLLFVSYYSGSSYSTDSYVYYGSSAGYSSSSRDTLPSLGGRDAAIEDYNNDGYLDIAICNYYDGSSYATNSYVYYGSSRGFSSSSRTSIPTQGCRDVVAADLNRDGYADLAFASHYSGSSYATTSYIYYGSAAGFSTSYRTSLPTYGSLGIAVSDFDQDGWEDVVFGGYHNGSWSSTASTYLYWNSSLGFSSGVYDSFAHNGVWQPHVDDLNSDGWDDLILPVYYTGSSHSGTSYVYYGSSLGFSTSARTGLPTVGAAKVGVGDADGDGLPEIVFNNYHSGSWSSTTSVSVYYGTASGYSSSALDTLSVGGVWAFPRLVGDSGW